MPAQLGQTTPQLRLKNYDQRDREKNREPPDDPADHDQIEQLRNQRQRQKNNRQSGQHLSAARPAKVEVAVVDPDAQQNDLEGAAPSSEPKMDELLNHFTKLLPLRAMRLHFPLHHARGTRRRPARAEAKSTPPPVPAGRSYPMSRSVWREKICGKRQPRAGVHPLEERPDCR